MEAIDAAQGQVAGQLSRYRNDFQAFAEDCLPIVDKLTGKEHPFKFNAMQRRFWKLEQECAAEGRPFWLLVLKIRQSGSSSYWIRRAYWKTIFHPYSHALIVGHDDDLPSVFMLTIRHCYETTPEKLRPHKGLDNSGILYFDRIKSGLHPRTAKNTHLGAGYTIRHVVFAEIGRYDEVTDFKTMWGSVMQTLPWHPDTSCVGESTAHGEGNFKKLWEKDNAFLKEFISYVAVDDYTDAWIEEAGHYRDSRIERKDFTLSEIPESEYGDETEEAEYIKKEIKIWLPELTTEQQITDEIYKRLSWRRFAINNKCNGDRRLFDQEYPITAEKAFQLSGDHVFPSDKLSIIIDGLRKKAPEYTRYSFDVTAAEDRDRSPQWWTLDNAFGENSYGHLYIYEMPEPGYDYVIGADPSEGISDRDESAVELLRVPELVEVAHFCKPIDPDQLGDMLYCLSRIYNDALVNIERNTYGVSVIARMIRDLRFRRLYYQQQDKVRIRPTEPSYYGWHSNIRSKPYMLGKMKQIIREDFWTCRNIDNAREHKAFKKLEDRYWVIGENGEKKSANRVMATGLAMMAAEEIHRFPKLILTRPEKNSIKYFEEHAARNSRRTHFW